MAFSFGDLFSNKKGIEQARRAQGAINTTAVASMEAVDLERARGIAGEQAKMAVWGLLGQEGTYGPDAANTFTQHTNVNNVDDPTSLFDTSGVGLSQPRNDLNLYGTRRMLSSAREGILDPDAYAAAISNSASFRIQSQRVAESEQLLNQEGPAWDMLNNSVLGVINEGSALQLRDTMRKLKNQYAKGGSARRTAMFEANELMAGERAMRTRVQQTWQANLALHDSVRQNADRVAAGTASFMAGLPLVNDSYRDAMQRTAQLQILAGEQARSAIVSGYQVQMTQSPVNFVKNFLESTIKMGPAIVGGALDSYLGAKGGNAGGASGEGGGVQGALMMQFGNDSGYTPMAGGGSGGMSEMGQFAFDTANMLKSAGDYINTEYKEYRVNSDLDTLFDDNPDIF